MYVINDKIAGWTPPEWVYNRFPIPHRSNDNNISTQPPISSENLVRNFEPSDKQTAEQNFEKRVGEIVGEETTVLETGSDLELVSMGFLLDVMHAGVDASTEWDSGPLGPVLHMAHMLVSHQGEDGLWASVLNLRTGEDVGRERTAEPVVIFRRLNEFLDSSEFDVAIRLATQNRAGDSKEDKEVVRKK